MEIDKNKIKEILDSLTDLYAEFFVTKNNLRLYLKQNLDLLFESVEKGDKLYYVDGGILFVTGYSDNYDRKYVKILVSDNKIADQLLKNLNELQTSLYIKIKNNNPIIKVLESNGFKYFKSRGKETLMRKDNKEK